MIRFLFWEYHESSYLLRLIPCGHVGSLYSGQKGIDFRSLYTRILTHKVQDDDEVILAHLKPEKPELVACVRRA